MWLSLVLLAATPPPNAIDESLQPLKEGPIDFVCDEMQLMRPPSRVVCQKNVVVRRGDLYLCCDRFEGYLTPEGVWQRLECSERVRAQRKDEIMWADRATFVPEINKLILTGHPRIKRGASLLTGERIVVDTKLERAMVEEPRGHVEPTAPGAPPVAALAALPLEGPVPRACPVPKGP